MAKIKDRSNDRKYFTMLPNIVWTMGLSVYDLWLYATIKRVAGEHDSCWMSTRQLSDLSGVSLGQISKSKDNLVAVGLISVDERESADGPPRDEITVCDVWEKNRFSCSQGDQLAVSCSPHDQSRSPGDQLRSPGDQPIIRKKKNPLRRTHEEEQRLIAACESIYQAYPRKVGKQDAIRAIEKTIVGLLDSKRFEDEAEASAWLLTRVETFSKSPAGQAGEYTPHPATWFNKGRFDDDDSEWQRKNVMHGSSRADDPRGNAAAVERYLDLYGNDPVHAQ